ncbi:MAG: hypothetical protein U1B79_01175, partial [Candidatus Pacearchaeota archaeon]|nr:hypothetical protein [Candidatus Pacearchaeota archaeon]
ELHQGHSHPIKAEPFVFCLGEGMFLKSIDDFLIGKEIGKYEIELNPEKAFGKRNPAFVQMIPMRIFREQRINPVPGITFNFDGRIGKVLAVSGGRVMVDFNNLLAGKTVIYHINVKGKVTDINEKIKAVNDFLFKQELDFSVEGRKLTIKTEKNMKKFVEMFSDKFKELLDLDIEVMETEKTKEENRPSDADLKEETK